ncbi:hypothetical protein POTOM_044655 [Populus tomentosa]|uniref:PGG domain-containing protein n=1 Tax=Populus tomentosa TaxID=118781 RepID=A0A8X7YMQ9_POPTO|nr:hypothetical protein POTOM_044655 [Populus tomentosa]
MANTKIDGKLYEYVKQDNIEEFNSRVQQRLAEKLVTPCGNTLLHVAVSYGSDNITSYLAGTFPSLITIQNSQEDTILHLAAREGKASDTIKSLVQSNPSLIMKKNTKANTPLHDAVIANNKEVAKLLVSRDPEVAYYNNNNGKSPLYLAVENGNKNGILDDLLNLRASFPIKSEDGDALPKGKSPVHAAIKQRNRDILEKIGNEKPELLRLTEEELGNSLHYASSIGFVEGVRFLLTKFLDGAYETNLEGNYPIHVACKSHSVVVKEFLDKFPYPKEFLNRKGQNILHVAAKYGNSCVVRFLLKQDQKLVAPLLNAIDEDGNTPLHLAAGYGRFTATFLLVRDNRVEHFIGNNRNWTPYEWAEDFSKIYEEEYKETLPLCCQRAEERKQFDSKNSTPAHEIKGKEVDSNKMDTKEASPKDEIRYMNLAMTLSILFVNARPKKSLFELFPVTILPMSRAREEARSMTGNLLVVAVLVAGVTFAGVIQLPQLRDNNNSSDREFNSTTYENLLYGYLFLDVGALSSSLAAALFLLLPSFHYPRFQISAVWFSGIMVCLAIYMMFGAFLFSVRIALIGSHGWLLTIIIAGVAVVFPSIIPLFGNPVRLQVLMHYIYYSLFLLFAYSRWWLPNKLSDLKKKHNL